MAGVGGGRWGGGSCLKLLRSAGKTLLRSAGEKRPTVYCATCALVVLPATTRPRQANNNTARYQPVRYSRVMCLMLAPSGSKRACRALTAVLAIFCTDRKAGLIAASSHVHIARVTSEQYWKSCALTTSPVVTCCVGVERLRNVGSLVC